MKGDGSRQYHHGDLRAALLDAAEVVLEREGIGGLTLRAVAREAGVSHAAPAHHFGDLAGLLSDLAATGFVRLRAVMLAAAEGEAEGRLAALGRGYVGFAQAHPGMFRLMFRAERLDWTRAALAEAGAESFGVLMGAAAPGDDVEAVLAAAMARWSLVHGVSTLLIDGRFAGVAGRVLPGVDVAGLVAKVLGGGL